jgi:hypothetical protein
MQNAAIDRVSVDVISADRLEVAVGIGADWPGRVAECAADVDVDVVEIDDEPGVVAAPGTGDLEICRSRSRRRACAGGDQDE